MGHVHESGYGDEGILRYKQVVGEKAKCLRRDEGLRRLTMHPVVVSYCYGWIPMDLMKEGQPFAKETWFA